VLLPRITDAKMAAIFIRIVPDALFRSGFKAILLHPAG